MGAAARFAIFGALGLPFAIYGTLWNVLPYKLTGWLAERFATDTTKIHYCQLAFGAPLYLLYYGLLLYMSYRLYGSMSTMIFALTLLPTGLFARGYAGRMARRRDKIRLGFIELHHGYYVQMLRQQRRRLIEELEPEAVLALHAPLACIDSLEPGSLARWLVEQTGLPLVDDVGYPTPGSFGTWGAERDLPVVTYEFALSSIDDVVRDHVPVLTALLTGDTPWS